MTVDEAIRTKQPLTYQAWAEGKVDISPLTEQAITRNLKHILNMNCIPSPGVIRILHYLYHAEHDEALRAVDLYNFGFIAGVRKEREKHRRTEP